MRTCARSLLAREESTVVHLPPVSQSIGLARSESSGWSAIASVAFSACLFVVACKQQTPAPPVPTPVPTPMPAPTPDTKRLDAIAALKAVNSVVENQGTLEQFRKYQLEAAIKVDTLPDAPNNTDIKAAAILYKHANVLAGISLSKWVFSSQLTEMRKTYADMPEFIQTLNGIDTHLADKEVKMAGSEGWLLSYWRLTSRRGRASTTSLLSRPWGFLPQRRAFS